MATASGGAGSVITISEVGLLVRGTLAPIIMAIVRTGLPSFDFEDSDVTCNARPQGTTGGSDIDLVPYLVIDDVTAGTLTATITPTAALWVLLQSIPTIRIAWFFGLPDGGGGADPHSEIRQKYVIEDAQAPLPS